MKHGWLFSLKKSIILTYLAVLEATGVREGSMEDYICFR